MQKILVHIRLFVILANECMIFLLPAYLLHLSIYFAGKKISLASKSDELPLSLNALEWLEG